MVWQTWLERTFPAYTAPNESGTTEQLAKYPAFEAVSDKTGPALQTINERAAPAIRALNENAKRTATAIAENEMVQGIRRRATESVETVRTRAQEIDTRYTPEIVRRATRSFYDEVATADDAVPAVPVQPKLASEKRLNVKNTAVKFALDQTFGAVINTALFIAGMDALKGLDSNTIIADLQRVSICHHSSLLAYTDS